jgi:hypothetical protein
MPALPTPGKTWTCNACKQHNPAQQETCGCGLRSTFRTRLIAQGGAGADPEAYALPVLLKFVLKRPIAVVPVLVPLGYAVDLWQKGEIATAIGVGIVTLVFVFALGFAVETRGR